MKTYDDYLKRVHFDHWTSNPSDEIHWDCRIFRTDEGGYVARLMVMDSYDGWLMVWKPWQSSPAFATVEQAEEYARREWAYPSL